MQEISLEVIADRAPSSSLGATAARRPQVGRWLALVLSMGAFTMLAACDDEIEPDPGPGPGTGATLLPGLPAPDQVGVEVTIDENVGEGYGTGASGLADNELVCTAFAATFGQDPEETARLITLPEGYRLDLYTVFRPAQLEEGRQYPLLTWGNGTCAQPQGYGTLLRHIASHGFIVVAANSRFVGTNSAMTKAIDWALAANRDASSPYYGHIDPNKIGAMGHSQGSAATAAAAADSRVKAVILFNGGTSASKPFLAVSGDRDLGGTAASYRSAVNSAAQPGAFLFYHQIPQTGSFDGHLTLMTQPERVVGPATAWWRMRLLNDSLSRDWFVGASCELCNQDAQFEYGQKGL